MTISATDASTRVSSYPDLFYLYVVCECGRLFVRKGASNQVISFNVLTDPRKGPIFSGSKRETSRYVCAVVKF